MIKCKLPSKLNRCTDRCNLFFTLFCALLLSVKTLIPVMCNGYIYSAYSLFGDNRRSVFRALTSVGAFFIF